MIKYALQCVGDHTFEGWFGASGDYDDQLARGLLECPVCGSSDVRKQIMSPAVTGTKSHRSPEDQAKMRAVMKEAVQQVRRHVEENFDYVGDNFAKEARAIHDGKSEDRGIYGEASPSDVRALVEDGVKVAALPPKPPEPEEMN